MSDVDDRMERAERIRKMRQSRDHDVADEEPAAGSDDSGATDSDGTDREDTDAAARGMMRADVNGDAADSGESDEETGSERGEPEPEQAVDPERGKPDRVDANALGDQELDATETTVAAVEERSSTEQTGAAADSLPTVGGGIAPLGSAAGASLSAALDEGDPSDGEASDEDVSDDAGLAAGTRAGTATTAAVADVSVRVLEFTVGEQTYCIDIDRVEEIVKRETITRVPNTPEYVEGVLDLRGQITTILDTKRLLDVEADGREDLLVIFAPDAFEDHGSVGWVVDEVQQVVPVTDDQVRTAPGDDEHVRGIVDRRDDDDLVLWIRPGVAMSRAVEGEAGTAADEA